MPYGKRNTKIKTHVLSRALAILSYITDDRDYKRVNWSRQSACNVNLEVCLFMSLRTFSTLYVNLWNCLPANVYLKHSWDWARLCSGVCVCVCVCATGWVCMFVWSPFPSLLVDRLCQSCLGNDVPTCDISQRQRRTQSSFSLICVPSCPFLLPLTFMRIDTYPLFCQVYPVEGPNHGDS